MVRLETHPTNYLISGVDIGAFSIYLIIFAYHICYILRREKLYVEIYQGIKVIYSLATFWLLLYGLNNYYIIYLFIRNFRRESRENAQFLEDFWKKNSDDSLPVVTTQLPIYNEKYVAERLIETVVGLDYPKELHEIQVLDDSTDETKHIVARLVEKWQKAGYNIKHIMRANREGFKAGALQEGLCQATGEFIAIFDADFLPEKDFLKKTVPFFYKDKRTAFVQTRWGHINGYYSFLTQIQSIALDSNFVVQGGRCWGGFYMGFNGTAGVWRKQAIIDAGGWHCDTLTEDLDLSYRAQLKGWMPKFLYEVVTPAEIPLGVNAFKNQQYRWAKGSIQTTRKLLLMVLRSESGWLKKLEAFFHLTNFIVYPLLLFLALSALPLILSSYFSPSQKTLTILAMVVLAIVGIASCAIGPSVLYLVSQRITYKDWKWRCLRIPGMLAIYAGMVLNNSMAVFDGLFTDGGEFKRTPKYGVNDCGKILKTREYAIAPSILAVFEVLIGLYCLLAFTEYLWNNPRFFFGPFLLVYAVGFLYVGGISLIDHWREEGLSA